MSNGWLAQQRLVFAKYASAFPSITRVCVFLRWLGWVAYGWPVAAVFAMPALMVTVFISTIRGAPMFWDVTGFVGSVLLWAWRVTPKTGWGAVGLGIAVACFVGGYFYLKVKYLSKVSGPAGLAVQFGLTVMLVWFTASTLGWLLTAFLVALVPVGYAFDIRLSRGRRYLQVRKMAGQFRRELPAEFANLSAKTSRVQDFDGRVENSVSKIAAMRPLFEHPPMQPWGRFDGNVVEWTVFRTPGRDLKSLADVCGVLSAQFFTVSDAASSIEVLALSGTDLSVASEAILRVTFKDPGAGSLVVGERSGGLFGRRGGVLV